MNFNVRYANHPDDAERYNTTECRKHYLIEDLFQNDTINFTYSHVDRIITGGIKPVSKELVLEAGKEMGVDYFLERREMGIINIGGAGILSLDGQDNKLETREGAYVGLGIKSVSFKSVDSNNPAKFYINSCPAHKTYPTVMIDLSKAKKVSLGTDENLNKRVIHQFVHPAVCDSCQLVMGMTILEPGSVWNTMPCHTHERRMEVYFYFDMAPETKVFHLMGKPNETRHIVMANEQAVISPSWSIHSGVGTSNYTFIWGMCGENKTFDDMDFVDMKDLK